MFSEPAGTLCPCYTAWHITSKTDLSFDTLSLGTLQDLRLGAKPPLSLPLSQAGELLPGAPWWPFPYLRHVITPHWGRRKGLSLEDTAMGFPLASILHGDPHILRER